MYILSIEARGGEDKALVVRPEIYGEALGALTTLVFGGRSNGGGQVEQLAGQTEIAVGVEGSDPEKRSRLAVDTLGRAGVDAQWGKLTKVQQAQNDAIRSAVEEEA